MKICFVTTSFIRSARDYYSYFIYEQALSVTMSSPGSEVTVVAPHADGYLRAENIGGIVVRRFPYFYPPHLQKLAYQTDGMFTTIRRSKVALLSLPFFLGNMLWHTFRTSKGADLVHAQWIQTALVVLPVKWLRGIPLIVSVRGTDLHTARKTRLSRFIHRVLLNRLDLIVTVSNDFKRILEEELKVNVPVIPLFNGVNSNFFCAKSKVECKTRLGLDSDRPMILFVGNIITHKGVDTLLESFVEVLKAHPTAQLVLAGEGPELEHYTKQAASLGIEKSVYFTDLIPRERIPDWINSAEMLVLPSRGEGRPNVVLEAMACKVPVVATAVGGTKELLVHEKTGLLFEPGDAKMLARHMSALLSDPSTAAMLGEMGHRSLHEQGLTWDAHGRRLRDIYESVLKGTPLKQGAPCAE